ncbi:hypothetical protein L7F22_000973 [Adiantum nelumboides]|nr:hypothetical protein [Adiantum nelumboides]
MKVPPFLSTKDKIFEAYEYTRDLDTAFAKVRKTLQKSQERQKKAADCHRRDLKLKENDWVLLRFEKARLRKKKGKERLFPKLSMRYYGPFQIIEWINDVSFRLRLPDTWKIHNAFHELIDEMTAAFWSECSRIDMIAIGDIPPVRGHGRSRPRYDVSQRQLATAGTTAPSVGLLQEESRPVTAAKHTYDYFGDKWDKFDVDAALRKVDEDDLPSSSAYQVEKKKKKVQEPSKQGHQTGGGSSNKLVPQARHTPTVEPVNGNGFASMLRAQALDSFVDATSEKEMGNKLFKEKKFVQAIECYSRSIALQSSAVSYANRAMAYLKIRRFEEAEEDCTEALALDDRYVKAYSRRATARKELGNILGAVADSEFALRLEPDNKELKEQYVNVKALCEKMVKMKPEEEMPIPIKEIRTINNAKHGTNDVIGSSAPVEAESVLHSSLMPPVQDTEREKLTGKSKDAFVSAHAVAASVAAARIATQTKLAAPKTFYEFEAAWKSFSFNSLQQAELLKVIKPATLPQLFKDNLSPKLLGEILRCLEHFFPDNANHGIEILESLTMAKRLNITAMCLTSKEKTELGKLWDEVFTGSQIDEERTKILCKLRPKFQL